MNLYALFVTAPDGNDDGSHFAFDRLFTTPDAAIAHADTLPVYPYATRAWETHFDRLDRLAGIQIQHWIIAPDGAAQPTKGATLDVSAIAYGLPACRFLYTRRARYDDNLTDDDQTDRCNAARDALLAALAAPLAAFTA